MSPETRTSARPTIRERLAFLWFRIRYRTWGKFTYVELNPMEDGWWMVAERFKAGPATEHSFATREEAFAFIMSQAEMYADSPNT